LRPMDGWRSYDSAAEIYAKVHAPRFAQPAADLVGLAEIGPGQRVLDLGTGTGAASRASAKAGAEATGVDASVGMLGLARTEDASARLVAGDAEELPFRSSAFRSITANFVLHIVHDLSRALSEVRRVLEPQGRFACAQWADGTDELSTTWRECLLTSIEEELLDDVLAQAEPGRDRLSQKGRLEETLLEAGFRQLWVERREYRFVYALDEYVDGLAATTGGRFLAEMLGPEFGGFMERTRQTFRERFADPLNDLSYLWLVVCRSG
jgi:ubiquinone/menaquinone biosynthesis C-methylase UbiE